MNGFIKDLNLHLNQDLVITKSKKELILIVVLSNLSHLSNELTQPKLKTFHP